VKKKKTGKIITFQLFGPTDCRSSVVSSGFRKVAIAISELRRVDAGKEVADDPRGSYGECLFERLQIVKAETWSTYYFDHFGETGRVEFTWQDDSDNRWEWYGCQVEYFPFGGFPRLAAKVTRQLHGVVGTLPWHEWRPWHLVDALQRLGAVPVRYHRCDDSKHHSGILLEDVYFDWSVPQLHPPAAEVADEGRRDDAETEVGCV
jgi:hypothetical protein